MFTSFDIIILTVIATSSMLGAYGGMVKVVINFLGFVSSILLAYSIYPYSYQICTQYTDSHVIAAIISSIFSYLICLVICRFLTNRLLAILSTIRGGFIDRLLGFGIGMIRGGIISVIIFWITVVFFSGSYLEAKTLDDIVENTTVDKYPVWLQDSGTISYLESISQNLITMIPHDQLKLIKLPKITENANVVDIDELEKTHRKKKVFNKNDDLPVDLERELENILYEKPGNEG